MQEQTIFDLLYPKFKFTKPIRLIELFAGYGSQALALKYLGVEFEHWKICEWAVKSIQAYKDIHFTDDNEDYSKNVDYKTICSILKTKGISSNYNEPMSMQQITRLSEKQVRKIYSNIIATNNLVNIQQVNGRDLSIVDTDKYDYVLTYSFPCQDLSLAGKGKGMSDTSTRSGMLWEVERILTECKELGSMPQVLLMENVPQVHSVDNIQDFKKWILRLEELGYSNYWQDLIATDYGIPQTRNRCFMISILGEYSYSFPPKQELKLKLKDMLEDKVDEKYFISKKMIEGMKKTNFNSYSYDNMNMTNKKVCKTLTTATGERAPLFIEVKKDTENYIEWEQKGHLEVDCRAYKEDKVMGTLVTTPKNKILIKNATKKGYLEAEDGDGVDISSRMEYHRGTVQKGLTQTLTTMGGENNGVVVNMKQELCNNLIKNNKVKENDVIRHSYSNSRMKDWETRSVEQNNISPTLDTRCDCLGVVNNMRIRKLTPKECFRLMGVKDVDFDKVVKNQSNASLYHLAGDSIVVNVLMAIFKEML